MNTLSRSQTMACLLLIALCTGGCGRDVSEIMTSADAAVAEGDYRTALVEYRTALDAEPANSEARTGLGRVYFYIGEHDQALRELEKAEIFAREPNADSLSLQARSLLALGRPDDAIDIAARLSETGEAHSTEAMLIRARALVQQRQWSEAVKLLDEVDATDESLYARSLSGRAEMALARGLNAHAKALLEGVLVLEPDDMDALNNLARLEIIAGDPGRAAGYLTRMADVAGRVGNRSRQAQAFNALMSLRVAEGDLDSATTTLAAIESAYPDTPLFHSSTASLLLAQGRASEALVSAQKALASDPERPEFLLLVARCNLAMNKLATAERTALRVLSIRSGDREAIELVADARLQQGRYEEAEQILQSHDGGVGSASQVAVARALAALENGDYASAIQGFQQALLDNPQSTAIRAGLARAYMLSGRSDEAASIMSQLFGESADIVLVNETLALLESLREGDSASALTKAESIVSRNPDDRHSWIALAFAQQASGQFPEAEQSVSTALKLSPGYPPALRFRAELRQATGDVAGAVLDLAALGESSTGTAGDALNQSALLAQDDQFDAAIEVLVDAIDRYPEDLSLYGSLAQLHILSGNNDAARALVQRAIDIAPGDSRAPLLKAQIEFADGRAEQALATLRTAYARNSAEFRVAQSLARLESRLGNPMEARSIATQALLLKPGDREMAELACSSTVRLGEAEAGSLCANNLVSRQPELASGHHLAGRAAMLGGQASSAVSSFRRAYELTGSRGDLIYLVRASFAAGNKQVMRAIDEFLVDSPGDEGILLLRAEALTRSDNESGAEATYEQVLQLNPDNVIAGNNLAWMLKDRMPLRAEALAVQAAQNAPTDASILDTTGWILLNNGKIDESVKYLRQAVEISGKNPEVVYHLAVALERSGARAEAAQILEESLAQQAQFDGRRDAEALLASIRTSNTTTGQGSQ